MKFSDFTSAIKRLFIFLGAFLKKAYFDITSVVRDEVPDGKDHGPYSSRRIILMVLVSAWIPFGWRAIQNASIPSIDWRTALVGFIPFVVIGLVIFGIVAKISAADVWKKVDAVVDKLSKRQ
jgi:hypothetical protein